MQLTRLAALAESKQEFGRKRTYVAGKTTKKFKKGDVIFITSAMNHPSYRVLLNDKIEAGRADVDDFEVEYNDLVRAEFSELKHEKKSTVKEDVSNGELRRVFDLMESSARLIETRLGGATKRLLKEKGFLATEAEGATKALAKFLEELDDLRMRVLSN